MDLLVGTMNGQLLLFESSAPADNIGNLWSSFPKDRLNGFMCGQKSISILNKQKFKQLDIQGRFNICNLILF